MKTTILSLLIITAFTCQKVETPRDFDVNMVRCENNEVICYYFKSGYKGGMSCKFKDQSADTSKEVGVE